MEVVNEGVEVAVMTSEVGVLVVITLEVDVMVAVEDEAIEDVEVAGGLDTAFEVWGAGLWVTVTVLVSSSSPMPMIGITVVGTALVTVCVLGGCVTVCVLGFSVLTTV